MTATKKLQGERNGSTEQPAAVQTPLAISAPKLVTATFKVRGTTPYVQHKFSSSTKAGMMATQMAGSTDTKKKKRDPKDFERLWKEAMYRPTTGEWPLGAVPATQFKAAMVAACRLLNFKMTEAKQCVFVEADGYDPDERIPLVRVTKGKPKRFDQMCRNDNGSADIRARPMWEEGWEALVRITYDSDRFTAEDVGNLLLRAGCQVGIGEGRMASRQSCGVGWGAFVICND